MRQAFIGLLLTFINSYAFAYGDNFTCPLGKNGACLYASESVCDMGSRCVSNSAKCFQDSTCDHKGYTCVSNLEDAVKESEDLKFDLRILHSKYNISLDEMSAIRNCIANAKSLKESKACAL